MCIRVKYIIIITDHRIYPERYIQCHLKRADLEFLRLGFQYAACHLTGASDQIEYCVINPVIMPLCIRTCIRVALCFPAKADFLLGSQGNALKQQPLAAKCLKCLLRNSSGDGLCRQIKKLLSQVLSHGPHRGKYSRHSLSHPGRRLDKQLFPAQDRAVNRGRQIPLTRAVGKWKFCFADRCIPFLFPCDLESSPFLISMHQILKPVFQLFQLILLAEPLDLFGFQIAVSHLYTDLFQPVL